MKFYTKIKTILIIVFLMIGIIIFILEWFNLLDKLGTKEPPIRIGILHSLTGTMANSEAPLVDVLLMAIDEINAKGGLLGRNIESIVVDGRSSPEVFVKEAERLLRDEKVDVLFGCWTSSCRKSIKPIVEKYNKLLFYPVQYEGLEESNNIIYTGAAPNQQIIPGINWALNKFGKNIYLLGSDYIFPRTANFIIRDIANIKKARVVAERYVPLGSSDFESVISEIKKLQPDVIINTINGDSNKFFFIQRRKASLNHIPVISFSLGEAGLVNIPDARTNSHFAVWNYFQSISSEINLDFIDRVQRKMGKNQVISDPMEASYIGIYLWAQAVKLAESTEVELVKKTINEQALNSPEGIVSIDSTNHHLRKFVRIGQARSDGQFDIIWKSKYAIRPVPFPSYRSRKEWTKVINAFPKERLYK